VTLAASCTHVLCGARLLNVHWWHAGICGLQVVGRRNYRYFVGYVNSVTSLAAFVCLSCGWVVYAAAQTIDPCATDAGAAVNDTGYGLHHAPAPSPAAPLHHENSGGTSDHSSERWCHDDFLSRLIEVRPEQSTTQCGLIDRCDAMRPLAVHLCSRIVTRQPCGGDVWYDACTGHRGRADTRDTVILCRRALLRAVFCASHRPPARPPAS
jgi:hypothetical protein